MTEFTGYAIASILLLGVLMLMGIHTELSKISIELDRIKRFLVSGVLNVRGSNK